MTFQKNWYWQLEYMDDVKQILKNQSMKIVNVEIASPEEDMKECTDMKIRITAGDVSVRLRRENCKYRDLTIRAYNRGYPTEIDKLRKGYGDWYLYGWLSNKSITEWMLVDINILRDNECFNKTRHIKMNEDNTGFISISISEIKYHNAIVASEGLDRYLCL